MNKFLYLSEEEKNAIALVVNGIDVKSRSLATVLRCVEKKQKENGDTLIRIGLPVAESAPSEQRPFFNCVALGDGLDAIEDLV